MITVSTTGPYEQNLASLLSASPEISSAIDQAVDRFKNNPDDTRLDTHPLRRSRQGTYALSVTDDIRVIFRWIGKRHALFLNIGTHPQVYPGYRVTPVSKLNDA